MKPCITYNQEIADEICDVVSTHPCGLKKLCAQNPHWPTEANIYRWMFRHESFRQQYARAKANQVECLVNEALDTARDGSLDTYIDEKGNERCDHEWVNRSRLKVDTIKWFASKLAPKLYGDKSGTDDVAKKLDEFKDELQAVKDATFKCLKSI